MSSISSRLQDLGLSSKRKGFLFGSLATLGTYLFVRTLYNLSTSSKTTRILRSPRPDQPGQKDIPYPSDALPGARDVSTPNGSIRAYEWGPPSGRKVLFIHGISTPCIAFASLAQSLVARGCRVCLFDLHGRGYSDAPDPEVVRQDMGLWTSQIFAVLGSSDVQWVGGRERFTVVGYSMGGGIGAGFASWFPGMVEGLVLIAPGGLLRHSRIARSSKILYSGLLPDRVVEYFVGRRLRGSPPPPPRANEKRTFPQAAEAEVPSHPAHAEDSPASIFPDRPAISVADAVAWQLSSHPGFLPSFISSIRYAPVSDEHERWQIIGQRCDDRKAGEDLPGLAENRVLVLLGKSDGVIVADEIEEDATNALGAANVKVVRLEGGHDVPIVNAKGCCEEIVEFWAGEVGAMA